MKKKSILLILLFLSNISIIISQELPLVINRKTDYRIIIPQNANVNEKTAALILRDYLKKISKCDFPIVDDSKKAKSREILIGITNRTPQQYFTDKKALLKSDGYYLLTDKEKLLILGGSGKGIIYGVCSLLEDYMQYRKYTPFVEFVPDKADIKLPQLDDFQVPPNEIRIINGEFGRDSLYALFRRVVDINDVWNDGDYKGFFVHTFNRLVPPEIYFKTHPEYYSLINGERVAYGQLCLSNPDIAKICIEALRKEIVAHPKIKLWSVSQNDNYYYCECDKCKAIDAEEGSPSGLMLRLVNEVAREFPDKIITTLAYQYTRKPPLITKPDSNVMITLCSIELNRSKPIETDPRSKEFVNEISKWSQLSNKIFLWDYITQFSSCFGPFPIYHIMQPNIQFFTKNNVIAHFQQANIKHSENFGELKNYLVSKLLWYPNENADAVINDFMKGYYGKAAPYLRQYFDKLHAESAKADIVLDIYGNPVWLANNILSEENMKVYNQLFDEAEKAVADDAAVLGRVEVARLPIIFSAIEIAKTDLFGSRGWYKKEEGRFVKKAEMNQLLERFIYLCRRDSVVQMNEKGLTPEQYYQNTLRNIDVQLDGNLAFEKKANCNPPSDPRYTGMGNRLLTNGVRGSEDYKINWLGWEAKDVVIEVDMDSIIQLNEIQISTLHLPDVWILHPVKINCKYSADGKNYYSLGEIKSDTTLKYKTDIYNFSFKANKQKIRYLKFEITATKYLPDWHAYKGNKSWVFVDEIIAK